MGSRSNKYGTFLTVLLVIIILVILTGIGFIVYNVARGNNEEKEMEAAMALIDSARLENERARNANNGEDDDLLEIDGPEGASGSGRRTSGGGSGNMPKKQYYQEYAMVGYIEITKTGIKLPILERGTDKALEVSVAIMYPDDAILKLNEPGNVVIMGHNYRNGKFFSNNKRLVTGDKIRISSYTSTLTYTIYEIFETTPGDTSFINRDTEGATEITLSTCTDDGAKRLIIKARAN